MFIGENFSLSDCSECVRLAPVLTANRVGINEMGTPADGVVPCEVGAPLPGCPRVRILVLILWSRDVLSCWDDLALAGHSPRSHVGA